MDFNTGQLITEQACRMHFMFWMRIWFEAFEGITFVELVAEYTAKLFKRTISNYNYKQGMFNLKRRLNSF